METLVEILAFIGVMTIGGLIVLFIALLVNKISDKIDGARYEYMLTHRFDNPPTAKCFCRDCAFYRKDGRCTLPGNDRYTPDCGFCYEADPKKEKRIKKNAIDKEGKTA